MIEMGVDSKNRQQHRRVPAAAEAGRVPLETMSIANANGNERPPLSDHHREYLDSLNRSAKTKKKLNRQTIIAAANALPANVQDAIFDWTRFLGGFEI
jgi:CRISPR/Cas system CMR-associated protein Cmr1 (group 7 of RAMP superfamily)